MKHYLLPALYCLLAAVALAAEPAIVQSVTWPDRVEHGEDIELAPLSADGAWGVDPQSLRYWITRDGKLVIDTYKAPSLIVVGFSWSVDGQQHLRIHRVQVGPAPEPNPDPIPPPPPGELAVVVVIEAKDTPTLAEAKAMAGLEQYLTEQKIWRRTVDKDQVEGLTKKPPAYLTPILAAMQQRDLAVPVLAVLARSDAGEFSVVSVEAMPETAAEAIEKVKKHNGNS